MSKIDKNIQEAREWYQKHRAEPLDLSPVVRALEEWETMVKALTEARDRVSAARKAAITARKAVTGVLKEAKQARRAASRALRATPPALE